MELTSSAFTDAGVIPAKYTCDGERIHPQLAWVDAPTDTVCFALLMEDPDVPRNLRPDGLFIHWLAWNMPPTIREISEGIEPPGVIGLNTRGEVGYASPCPPDRMHRYYFRLYALDAELLIPSTATKGDLMNAMEGHILDRAELMGRYERVRK